MTGPSLNADGSLLSVQGLARSYVEPAPAFWRRARRRPVLADIDLAIHPGERVALIGASGAGKTTLLRTLLAIEEPDCGHILCQCQPVKPAGPAALRWYRRQVQYIPQDPAASLDPRMSVLAQVREPLHRLDVDCDCRSRAAEALASVGLGPEFHERRRAELSGGQAQRVAIARAIATRPALLVADEPVSGLDLPIRRQVSDVLLRLSKARGTALLVVSHDLASVARLCERILVMSEGRIVEDRPTGELVASPRHPSTRALIEAARLAHSRPG